MEKKIANLIKRKGKPFSISPEATVFSALEMMALHDIGFLVVMDGSNMVGVFSERDYARKVELLQRDSRTTKVSEIMVTGVYSIDSEQSYDEAMALMSEKDFRHLPVIKNGRVVAVISLGDVVKACINNQKETIDFLEDIALDK
jgi:CBS domain-containing protein